MAHSSLIVVGLLLPVFVLSTFTFNPHDDAYHVSKDLYVDGNVTLPSLKVHDKLSVGDIKDVGSAIHELQDGGGSSGESTATSAYNPLYPYYPLRKPKVLDLLTTDPALTRFMGGFSDGRYGFFIPFSNLHSKITRVDLMDFTTVVTMDISSKAVGFYDGFHDGMYGYLVPYYDGSQKHGKLVRFDLETFDVSTATVLDLQTIQSDLVGYFGGFVHNNFGYLAPYYDNSGKHHGRVARVDLMDFSTVTVLDLETHDPELAGFMGGFSDEKYGYFVPQANNVGYDGKIARVDLKDFTTVSSLDLTATASDLSGFMHGFTDGIYGYFCPYYNDIGPGGRATKLARVDLRDFSSVEYFDLQTLDPTFSGYGGGFIHGKYLYLSPFNDGNVVRIDVTDFATVEVLDMGVLGYSGYMGGFTDGKYGYLSPYSLHGNLTRILLQ